MRNLKRALSLALAFVMVMSLMIVGTSAKSYTDADKIDNQVAVEILGELGVMIGNDDGSFAPDRDVTRAEMAVLITRILYGNNLNVDQFKDMNTFTDVPDWAEGFVNLCASLDIIAGRGNGIFDPDATVTSAEAALMLSRALGYFKNNAEFGSDWALAAMKRATQVGIIGGDMVLQANAGLDRDDVAQMTFNTLTKAVPVQYNELLDVYYNVNQGVIYALEFNYLQTLGYTNFNLVYKSNQTVEYGRPATTWGIGSYKDAGNGTASGIEKADLTPAGGLIASNVRMLAKDEIITVNNTPTYVYSQDTAEKDVYADLGADVCTANNRWNKDGYTWTAYINGVEDPFVDVPNKVNGDYKYTDKGSVTEVYVDDYAATVTVVEINYYLGQVSKVDDENGTTTIRALSPEAKRTFFGYALDDKTFATTEFAEDEYVVFTIDFNDDNDLYICEMMAPETATGVVTVVDNDDRNNTANNANDDTYVCLDDEDTEYYYASDNHNVYDLDNGTKAHPELDEEYILYMTPAGYVLGYKLANETVSQYLYVENSDEELNDWAADVILPDATEPEIQLDRDLDNTPDRDLKDNKDFGNKIRWVDNEKLSNIDYLIWDYSVNSNDEYSLTYVPVLKVDTGITVDSPLYQYADTVNINNGDAYVEGSTDETDFIVDQDTIFVDTMNHVAYTGYDEVPDVVNAEIKYVVEDGVAAIVYIFDGEIYDANHIFFMLTSDSRVTKTYDGDKYWEYKDAYVDGHKQSMLIATDALKVYDTDTNTWVTNANVALEEGVLYEVMKTKDEQYRTEIRDYYSNPDNTIENVVSVANDSFRIDSNTSSNGQKYNTDADTIYVVRETKYDHWGFFDGYSVYEGDLDDMYKGIDPDDGMVTTVSVIKADGTYAELVYIFYYRYSYGMDEANAILDEVKNLTGKETSTQLEALLDKVQAAQNFAGLNDSTKLQLKLAVEKVQAALEAAKLSEAKSAALKDIADITERLENAADKMSGTDIKALNQAIADAKAAVNAAKTEDEAKAAVQAIDTTALEAAEALMGDEALVAQAKAALPEAIQTKDRVSTTKPSESDINTYALENYKVDGVKYQVKLGVWNEPKAGEGDTFTNTATVTMTAGTYTATKNIEVSFVATDYENVKDAVAAIGSAVSTTITSSQNETDVKTAIETALNGQYTNVTVTATINGTVSGSNGDIVYKTASLTIADKTVSGTTKTINVDVTIRIAD